MQVVQRKVEKVASARVPVLIQGESGTGKEIIAKLIHLRSPWRDGPFVKVHCPAVPATLLESELFGYEKGAFTGASQSRPGRVEMAERGTLLLDEITELDLSLQAKLLQLLQDGQFARIGAWQDTRVEVQVICATNRKMEQEIKAGNFRQDLLYRINVVDITLPPLRERRDDIPQLVGYFLKSYNKMYGCQVPPPSPSLMQLLQKHSWPGNIRELENLMRRYVILASEEAITSDLLGHRQSRGSPEIPPNGSISLKKLAKQATQDLERKIILGVLEASRWNRKRAARALNISYGALLYKIHHSDLSPKSNRPQTGSTVELDETADRLPKEEKT
jgi:two-component system response regulator AtoC